MLRQHTTTADISADGPIAGTGTNPLSHAEAWVATWSAAVQNTTPVLAGFLLAVWLCAGAVHQELRADIVQPLGDNAFSNGGNPFVMGQSFEADVSVATLGTIGFLYLDSNTSLADPLVTIDLFAGLGFGGALVDSASTTVPTNLGTRFVDLDFAGVSLIPGNDYSFRLSKGAGAGGVYFKPSADLYTGGTRLDETGAPLSGDLAFRVLSVPEPSSLALAAFAFAGASALSIRRRMRARVARAACP